jgi:hypothetical protein
VVSKRECLDRFPRIRGLAAAAGVTIDPDPAVIREWSLVKVLAGVLIARERGIAPPGTEIVVHGSGHYTDASVPPLPERCTEPVRTPDDLAGVLTAAASRGPYATSCDTAGPMAPTRG